MKVTVVEYFVLQGSSINHEMVKVSRQARKNPNILKSHLMLLLIVSLKVK